MDSPSEDSAPPSLEERVVHVSVPPHYKVALHFEQEGGDPPVCATLVDSQTAIDALNAEIARLTAEREDLRGRLEEMGRLVDFANRTTDSTLARAARAEEEARRYREALEKIHDDTQLDTHGAYAALMRAAHALTEGADHVEQ